MFGSLMLTRTFVLTKPMVTGFIPMRGGPGRRITAGVGRHSTMAAGFMTAVMAGCGGLVTSGHLPGLPGARAATITVGLRFLQTLGTAATGGRVTKTGAT